MMTVVKRDSSTLRVDSDPSNVAEIGSPRDQRSLGEITNTVVNVTREATLASQQTSFRPEDQSKIQCFQKSNPPRLIHLKLDSVTSQFAPRIQAHSSMGDVLAKTH